MSLRILSFSILSFSFFCSRSVLAWYVATAFVSFWILPVTDLWYSLKSLACWRMLLRYSCSDKHKTRLLDRSHCHTSPREAKLSRQLVENQENIVRTVLWQFALVVLSSLCEDKTVWAAGERPSAVHHRQAINLAETRWHGHQPFPNAPALQVIPLLEILRK